MIIKKKIIEKIKNKNSISLDEFIKISLFDKNGYYSKKNPLGKKGDFITSPDISQLFGEILGLYIYEFWEKKIQTNFNLIELGPGNGTLLLDILRITREFPNFHSSMNINLIELNSTLIKIQKKKLINNNFNHIKKTWNKNLDIIKTAPSIIISNEFFDCFPIKQFQIKNNEWYEKFINYSEKKDIFFYEMKKVKDSKSLKELKDIVNIEFVEYSFERDNYFSKLCNFLSQTKGLIITSDYGYLNLPDHSTLQCVYNHKYSNLFDNIGDQDITSEVNFQRFIKIANINNLNIDKFSLQHNFLIDNGIIQRKERILKNCNEKQAKELNFGLNRLIEKNKMGSLFKFLIISN